MELYRIEYPVARKQHRCEFCGKKIEPKEQYSLEVGNFDGDFFVRKLCLPCNGMLSDYMASLPSGETEFEWWGVIDSLADEYCISCPDAELCEIKTHPQTCETVRKLYEPKIGIKGDIAATDNSQENDRLFLSEH